MIKALPLLALGAVTFASGAAAQLPGSGRSSTPPPCLGASPPAGAIVAEAVGHGAASQRNVGGQPLTLVGRWNSDAYTRFHHVLAGPPGKLNVNLHACTSASSGEPVAVYVTDSNGNRKLGWRLVVIASRNGNGGEKSLTLPAAPKGQSVSKLPIVVVVENASRRPHVGEYWLTISR